MASPESQAFDTLQTQLDTKSARIAVIGLGYVGLPLIRTLHDSGFSVVGFDVDDAKISKLLAGESYIRHIAPTVIQTLTASERFRATSDFTWLRRCSVFILCLPTPVGAHNEPDMSFVLSTTRRLATVMPQGSLVVLESTTYPGATDTDVADIFKDNGFRVGENIFIAYSPEREDPANDAFATHTIPKLVGGVDKPSTKLVEKLYSAGGFETVVRVSSARVAECAKLLENTYRAVNIALVNELKIVFQSMNVNVWEVLDAAATKPFGFHRLDPGPGIGGHCIPVDPFYLTWKGKETGATCSFIELAASVNARMPLLVVDKIKDALNDHSKSVKGSRILLLGIAYKPNVDDIRESPSLVIWDKLLDLSADVSYHDPFVPVVCSTRKHPRLTGERSVEIERNRTESKYDAVVVITNHSTFEGFEFLKGFDGPVVDTRNCVPARLGVNVILA